ncbi:MAG: mechanosensitive ion channel family protein [Candidatus Nanohaloarchaea archaeon]|nr:mechanosensitive ion channel family protein [Candidatus Nanohaloarchaea archaeon]
MALSIQSALSYFAGFDPIYQFIFGIVATFMAAWLLEYVVLKFCRVIFGSTSTDLDDIIFEEAHQPLFVAIWALGIYISFTLLEISATWLFYIRALLLTAVTVFWTPALITMGKRFFSRIKKTRYKHRLIPIFENLWTFVVILAAVFALLKSWSIDITPLLASAGIAGVAIGFAAKDTIANFFGGIALYFDQTYEIGDYIVVDSGESGTVVDVGVRSTTLRTRDDVIITVPNSVLNSSKIENQSDPKDKKRVRIPIGVAYGTDIDSLEEILIDIAEEEELVISDPEPRVRFRDFGDSALNYELLCWVGSPEKEPKAVHNLNRSVYKRLGEEGIEIPFPQRVVHMEEE